MKSRENYKGNNTNTFDKNGKIEKPNPNTKVMISVFMNMQKYSMSQRDRAYVEDMIAILERLDWYESQDLIRREDVKRVFSDYLKEHECLDDDRADFVAEKKCDQIPKAEPPKE